MSVHVLLHLLNEMRKIDNMRGSAKDVIIYHEQMEYSSLIFERKCMFYLSYDIFAFAFVCIDKSLNCQEFNLTLLKARRHIAAYVLYYTFMCNLFVYIYKLIVILFAWPLLRLCDICVFIRCLLLTMSEA